MIFPDQLIAIFGEINMSNPMIIVAVYSPGIAGFLIILFKFGFKGLGQFLKRLTYGRASLGWWLLLIFLMPVVMYAGAAIKGNFTTAFPFSPWYQDFPALALALFLGPIEEFGWRGLALPLMQRKPPSFPLR